MYVYDPIAAGAGKTMEDHRPNVTGVGSFPPVEDTIKTIQQVVPGVKVVGTLYNSSEANSQKVVSVARELFHKRGIRLEEIAITNTSEAYQAAQALATRNIQAYWITGDNTALQAFSGIAKVALQARLPLNHQRSGVCGAGRRRGGRHRLVRDGPGRLSARRTSAAGTESQGPAVSKRGRPEASC